jgi:hypothetical protein
MNRIIVLEANEVPARVLEWWADRAPSSAIARLLSTGAMTETVLVDELPRDLYPSQSWASLGMGVPYSDHGVFWYGDPKPDRYPFYWQAAAAAGRTVGLMGVLHTSPRADQADGPNYRFVVPDLFGDDPTTVPSHLQPIQELNLRLSRQAARVARIRPSVADVGGALSLARNGVRPSTWVELTKLTAQVVRGAWNKERLRVGQSLLAVDVFERLVRRHDPDLSVVFANHVAAFMHRYWAASFPEDWPTGSGYTEEWVQETSNELPYAMEMFDRVVARLVDLAESTDRAFLLVSSMGQHADTTVDPGRGFQAVIRQPDRFLAAAGLAPGHEVRSAMVPQLTVVAESEQDAAHVQQRMEVFLGDGLDELMIAHDGDRAVMTFTCAPRAQADKVFLGGRWVEPSIVGMTIEAIEDHRSGRHSPRGVLLSNKPESWPSEIDAFAFAPMVLEQLGVPALPHHRVGVST